MSEWPMKAERTRVCKIMWHCHLHVPGDPLCITDSRKSAGVIKYCPSTSMVAKWSNFVFRRVCEWPWSGDLARTTFTDGFLFWPSEFHSKQQPTPPIPTTATRNKDFLLANEENIAPQKDYKYISAVIFIKIFTKWPQTFITTWRSFRTGRWTGKAWALIVTTADQASLFFSVHAFHF